MDQLVRFVMDNFVLVAIAVGIVYSLFFRKSPLERPRNRMPDFGGGNGGQRRPPGSPPTRGVPMRPRPEQPARPRETPPAVSSAPPEPASHQSSAAYEAPAAEAALKPREKPVSAAAAQAAPYATIPSESFGNAPTREDLERAIVWSEILGPPRARRPHRK